MGRERDAVVSAFGARLVSELVDNNTLRGSWVEQLVAHYLGISEFPGQWNYFDLRDATGRTISVKHSTGSKARWAVGRHQWAWDNSLPGWRGGDERPAQHWCDLYVFGLLDPPVDYDRVTNPACWTFGVVSRAGIHRLEREAKTVGVPTLTSWGVRFVPGPELASATEDSCARDAEISDVPELDLRPSEEPKPAPPSPAPPVASVDAANISPD